MSAIVALNAVTNGNPTGATELCSQTETKAMPIFLGMILGVILTIAAAFAYDTSTGRVPNGLPSSAANGNAPLVNWDVATDDWAGLKAELRKAAVNVEIGWKKLTS